MAGIYEKHTAIKSLLFKEAEKRDMTVPLLAAYGQAEGWLAFAMKCNKSNAK